MRTHLQQSVLGLLWAGLQSLGGVDDGDGHEANGEVSEGHRGQRTWFHYRGKDRGFCRHYCNNEAEWWFTHTAVAQGCVNGCKLLPFFPPLQLFQSVKPALLPRLLIWMQRSPSYSDWWMKAKWAKWKVSHSCTSLPPWQVKVWHSSCFNSSNHRSAQYFLFSPTSTTVSTNVPSLQREKPVFSSDTM